jgi:hypothetical protein
MPRSSSSSGGGGGGGEERRRGGGGGGAGSVLCVCVCAWWEEIFHSRFTHPRRSVAGSRLGLERWISVKKTVVLPDQMRRDGSCGACGDGRRRNGDG